MRRLFWIRTIMALMGLGLLGGVAWDKFGNIAHVNRDQSRLEQAWSLPQGEQVGIASAASLVTPPEPLPGSAIARIAIPRLGQKWIVVEGTALSDIVTAPGHYSFSQMPG